MSLGFMILVATGFWIIFAISMSMLSAHKEIQHLKSITVPPEESKRFLESFFLQSSISPLLKKPLITRQPGIIINQKQITIGAIAALSAREISALFHFNSLTKKRLLFHETLKIVTWVVMILSTLILPERDDPNYDFRFYLFIGTVMISFIVQLTLAYEEYRSSIRLEKLEYLLATLPDREAARSGISKLLAADPETNFPRAKEINELLNQSSE